MGLYRTVDKSEKIAIFANLIESRNNANALGLIELVETFQKEIDLLDKVFNLLVLLESHCKQVEYYSVRKPKSERLAYHRFKVKTYLSRLELLGY